MHIAIFLDQHIHSLGGTQVSIRLQRKFLEKLGHTVTLVMPDSKKNHTDDDPHLIQLPSFSLTKDGEYAMPFFGKNTEQFLQSALSQKPPIDIVHVQAEFSVTWLGYRYAKKHNIPIVHTFHHWLEQGLKNTLPFPKTGARIFGWQQHRLLKKFGITRAKDSWEYLRNFSSLADVSLTPTEHFASVLKNHGVGENFIAIPTGVDDDIYEKVWKSLQIKGQVQEISHPVDTRVPRLIWLGRLSGEKRIMTLLEALPLVKEQFHLSIIGTGQLENQVRKFIQQYKLSHVKLLGKMPYETVLAEIAQSDLMVQTSISFETQGMTVYEAAAFGTPIIISDTNIAHEMPAGTYTTPESSTPEGLAQAIDHAIRTFGNTVAQEKSPFMELRQSVLSKKIENIYQELVKHP